MRPSKLGKSRELPILIDVDGVCANFHQKVLDYIERRFGIKEELSRIYTDVRNVAGDLWDDEAESFIRSDGFARDLEPIPGAIEAIKEIQDMYEVVFLTCPYEASKTWCYDRYMWLRDHFQVTRDDVIFARDKRFVQGRTLIDDRWENILDWSSMNGLAILYSQPWNEVVMYKNKDLLRIGGSDSHFFKYENNENRPASLFIKANSWDDVLKELRDQKKRDAIY